MFLQHSSTRLSEVTSSLMKLCLLVHLHLTPTKTKYQSTFRPGLRSLITCSHRRAVDTKARGGGRGAKNLPKHLVRINQLEGIYDRVLRTYYDHYL